MSYDLALGAAGATVLAFERFGSYQGDWIAKVRYDGRVFYVSGEYGSCPTCDGFEAEFEGDDVLRCKEHRYYPAAEACPECDAVAADYKARVAAFGRGYLESPMTADELIAKFSKNSSWDMGADKMVAWVKQQEASGAVA